MGHPEKHIGAKTGTSPGIASRLSALLSAACPVSVQCHQNKINGLAGARVQYLSTKCPVDRSHSSPVVSTPCPVLSTQGRAKERGDYRGVRMWVGQWTGFLKNLSTAALTEKKRRCFRERRGSTSLRVSSHGGNPMTQPANQDRFALFVNERKNEDRDPDYTGSLTLDGIEYFLDGWRGRTKAGKPMLSGRMKRKAQQQAQQERNPRAQQSAYEPPRRPNGEPAPMGDAE